MALINGNIKTVGRAGQVTAKLINGKTVEGRFATGTPTPGLDIAYDSASKTITRRKA